MDKHEGTLPASAPNQTPWGKNVAIIAHYAAPENQISRGGAAYELAWNNNSRRYLKRGDENSALPNRTGRKNRGKRYTGAPNDNRIVPRRRHLAPARWPNRYTATTRPT